MNKKAKVLYQETLPIEYKPFTETIGICSCCGYMVSRNQYGFDEVCLECGAELDWGEE